MNIEQTVQQIAYQSTLYESGYINIKNLNYNPEVRKICEGNLCRGYAASWACPPAVGTLEECKERVSQFDKMLLFSKRYELEDSFDFEGMNNGLLDFKKTVEIFNHHLQPVLTDYLLLANEGCGRCKKCTYPDSPCRFPHLLYHSLEGYGFIVSDLAKEAGIRYNNGSNTVTYFGALLYNS